MVAVNVSLTVSTGYINTFEERKVIDKTYEMREKKCEQSFFKRYNLLSKTCRQILFVTDRDGATRFLLKISFSSG